MGWKTVMIGFLEEEDKFFRGNLSAPGSIP